MTRDQLIIAMNELASDPSFGLFALPKLGGLYQTHYLDILSQQKIGVYTKYQVTGSYAYGRIERRFIYPNSLTNTSQVTDFYGSNIHSIDDLKKIILKYRKNSAPVGNHKDKCFDIIDTYIEKYKERLFPINYKRKVIEKYNMCMDWDKYSDAEMKVYKEIYFQMASVHTQIGKSYF